MPPFYTISRKLTQLSFLLANLFFFATQPGWAQVPYPLSAGAYAESFADIAGWTANFAAGTGASRFGAAAPDPTLPNTNTVFTASTSGGVQKGAGAIVLLATGADGANAAAFDLYLDFSGRAAGTISLDWAEVNNSTGSRQSTFKLQTNTGPTGSFVDLPQTALVITNNQAAAGRLSVALPAAFANKALAKVRFYLAATAGGTAPAGSRPKISLDNLEVTSTAADGPAAATITTGAVSPTSFCVTATAASPAFDVAFTSTGTLSGPYQVQLSDASGVFPASPTAGLIGSGGSSPIAATIPAGTPSGAAYRVRVMSDAPATTGTSNGADLRITLTPATNPVGITPQEAQTVTTTGTGATLAATAAAGSTFAWHYATSASGPFTPLAGATAATYQVKGADFPGAGTYFLVAQARLSTGCGTAAGTSDPVALTVAAPTPTPALNVSLTSLPDFGAVIAQAASAPKSFTVRGDDLTGPITVTPPAGFEIRTGAAPFACCAIVLTPAAGSVPSTAIDVRFAPTVAQALQATILVASPGQPDQAVAVAGTGIPATYPATLSTTAVAELTPTSATTGGSVATDGGSPVTARGVVWATTSNPTTGGPTKTADGAGPEPFASALSGLLPGTTYFVRAYATNGLGTAYGEELTFTTVAVPLAAEPTAPATLTARQVASTSLALNLSGGDGQKRLVLARLGAPVDAAPTDATTYLADPAFGKGSQLGKGNFVVYNGRADSVAIAGLRPGTPYYFAVFAFSDNETPYAENYLTATPGTLAQATLAAPAALLLEESFAYPAAALLTATGNWAAHSGAGTRPVAVTAAGLSYPGYGAAGGNAAALVASGEDVNRPFEPVYARTPVYVSFLVKVNSVTTTGDYFLHLAPRNIGSGSFRSRVAVRKDAAGQLQFGITGGTGAIAYTPARYELGTTCLLVVKYSFDEAGNVSQLFVNPATDTEPATADATATETGPPPAAPNDNIGSLALRQGASSPNLVVDGLRVGTSYRVVKTGLVCLPPVPAFTAAPVCAGTPTAFADASTAVEATATYAWDVNGDGTTDYTTRGNLTHQYEAAGTYTATLTITQGSRGACAETFARQVTVRARPTATLGGEATVCAGSAASLRVQLTGTAPWRLSYAANGVPSPPLTITAADVDAEGAYQLTVSPPQTTTYTLAALSDANCTAATLTGAATVTVSTPPVLTVPAALSATAAADQCGTPVAFAATAAGAPVPVVTYAVQQGGRAIEITPAYVFPVGTTTVTATATNSCGTDIQTFTVTVRDQQAPTVRTRNLTVALQAGGAATVTAAQVDDGSADACGIAAVSLSKTAFGCENIGANSVTLTVTDVHGNVARQAATVTVTGSIPTPTIAVTPASSVYTGGVPTTLYRGYGPQSLTLTAAGGVRYQWSPSAGLSDAASASPVFAATAAGRFTYTVTVTSSSGCTATRSITLTVLDVRCGSRNDKVSLCFKGKALCVSAGDVPEYLRSGGQLGNCLAPAAKAAAPSALRPAGQEAADPLEAAALEAYPNPFTTQTVLRFRPARTGPARLLLYNALGQLVQTLHDGPAQAQRQYQFTVEGAALPAGLYTGRLQIEGKVQTVRLVLSK